MDTSILIFLCSLNMIIGLCICSEEDKEKAGRFSIFQIIKFKNEPCIGSSRNGTCFTSAECDNAGGTESGSCADGFGVCCIVLLTNGQTTSLNQSYIVQASSTSLTAGQMQYTICPCSSEVCRIRFDFTNFELAAPNTGLGSNNGGLNMITGGALGDCVSDQFSVAGPNGGSPVICGTNAGQHLIVDANGDSCHKVNFGIGSGSTTRTWDIMVTQYRCGEEAGGPPGCLQWHMARMGRFRSFNFPDNARGVVTTNAVTHLSNQQYSICIRKDAAASHVCYIPCTYQANAANTASAAIKMDSFGVSAGTNAAANSGVGSSCIDDYIEIVGGTNAAIAALGTNVGAVATGNTRFCGRFLTTADAVDGAINANGVVSVCSTSLPFRVGVNFDENELSNGANANEAEDATVPGGIIGFSLCYTTPGA